jgi:predicted nucleic acid-binding protein
LAQVDDILDHESMSVEPATHDGFLEALDLYRRRPDKDYSLVDCHSMLLMRRHRLAEVLTSDHGFEQEGFRILLSR